MKLRFFITALLIYFTSCHIWAQSADTDKLKQWKAGETVSLKAAQSFGLCNCFCVTRIPEQIWQQMQGKTYRQNPHVGRHDLRYVKALHWDVEGRLLLGEMICHSTIAHELSDILRQLFEARYPIQQMRLPDIYGAEDELQMSHNNSSCFCYRNIGKSQTLSKHARGLAVDLNPLYNPYVRKRADGSYDVRPKSARPYTNRNKPFSYKIERNDLAHKLFTTHGYQWGGAWRSLKDYQHFEKADAHIQKSVILGNAQPNRYLPLLKGKRVALFGNHSSIKGEEHLLDFLVRHTNVTAIYSPEHGFRGDADAGAHVADGKDARSGVPILSLYGKGHQKHLQAEAMQQFDILVVDIQDVGLRFYTYYITMCRLMDACAQHGKEVMILDRPNPNGHYVDGPLLDMSLKSGVGHLPIPIVHGLTLGELARMAIGEKWLQAGNNCKLTVIPCQNYTHQTRYDIPVAPSPNLPNMQSILLYPSLCLFEGTVVSLGRGTDKPFQQYGHPLLSDTHQHFFAPESRPGAQHPPLQGQVCYGEDLTGLTFKQITERKINLDYVIQTYRALKEKGIGEEFFTPFFDKLMGQTYVRQMIVAGHTEQEIRARWQKDFSDFKLKRKKYLLYPE